MWCLKLLELLKDKVRGEQSPFGTSAFLEKHEHLSRGEGHIQLSLEPHCRSVGSSALICMLKAQHQFIYDQRLCHLQCMSLP